MVNSDFQSLLDYFDSISKIPRCSQNQRKIREYVLSEADRNDLEAEKDKAGNVVIRKPRTVDCHTPTVTLQCHMDMVCKKDKNINHDFSTDPIPIKRKDGWITAEGTTLGADNGIGIASCLALATSEKLRHGPLEFLFTVDEETGLEGAFELNSDFIKGKKLINLDNGDFGSFTVGCAGGGITQISLPLKSEIRNKPRLIEISISGLKGGHSGRDIHKNRANSIKILGKLLQNLNQKIESQVLLHGFRGGSKHNTIPQKSKVSFWVELPVKKINEMVEREFSRIRNEYHKSEDKMKINVGEKCIDGSEVRLFDLDSSRAVTSLIQSLPHGVLSTGQYVENSVETSVNLAKISTRERGVEILMSARSNIMSELKSTRKLLRTISKRFGAKVDEDEPYPTWEPEDNSQLLEVMTRTFKDLFHEKPKTKVIHAGLETSVIGEKFNGMDMISIGPEIKNPHTTGEKVKIKTMKKFWRHLVKSLEVLVR